MGSTKTRILHPPTVAQAVGQACILLPPRVRLVRLALQGSTMVQVKQQQQVVSAISVAVVNTHKMLAPPPAQYAQQDTTKTKMKQHSTLAKNAKREDIKTKTPGKQPVKVATMVHIRTNRDKPHATPVHRANTHRMVLV